MSDLEFFKDDLLLEVGRVAALRGSLRLSLLSAGDAVLSTRLGDQGIARLMMDRRELPEICRALLTLAQVRGVGSEAVRQLAAAATEFGPDFESAAAVANGSWTYLGGVEERHYGLFLGEFVRDGNLEPQWRHMTVQDLRGLVQRLERASETLRPLGWAMRAAGGQGREQKP
ncbi:MAG TPA: hypothetical protein VN048_13545 [Verrucomicrobiae bacterium]|jgi:hypothetical protein|nr:hypothetical protein [Verrucomicrobiae bacterium]